MVHGERLRHVEFMFGHAGGGGEGRARYDKGPGLKAAAETLALLRYPEVDLSHLYIAHNAAAAAWQYRSGDGQSAAA